MQDTDRIPKTALDWYRAGRAVALVIVMDTWGSAPRRAGSMMAVAADGAIAGSVAGGCVEGAAATEAAAALRDGQARIVTYGVEDGRAMAAGLACGGTIRLLIAPVGPVLPAAILSRLVSAHDERSPVALVWNGDFSVVEPEADDESDSRFRADRSGVAADGRFLAILNPPLRLIVVGAVQIAQVLLPMARACDYDCTLVDPRSAFASAARFPGERIVEGFPDLALTGALAPDARTAVVTLSHDAKIDDPALRRALKTPAFYIGCLGSSRSHAIRLERLAGAGDLSRLHGPVGLRIGAATPAEIAVSILAEMTAQLRRV
ncbi:MAG: XdhC family protein [Paracoccaceae bacterium]